MGEMIMEAIGYIESPFKSTADIPPQSIYAKEKTAIIKIEEKFKAGLEGLELFSHIIVLFYFHESDGYSLRTRTRWSSRERGVFASRSPHRPNHIGFSVVELLSIVDNIIEIKGVDMLDNTPVLDIKPYSPGLNPENVASSGLRAKTE